MQVTWLTSCDRRRVYQCETREGESLSSGIASFITVGIKVASWPGSRDHPGGAASPNLVRAGERQCLTHEYIVWATMGSIFSFTLMNVCLTQSLCASIIGRRVCLARSFVDAFSYSSSSSLRNPSTWSFSFPIVLPRYRAWYAAFVSASPDTHAS